LAASRAVTRLEWFAGLDGAAGVAAETRLHLSTPSGLRLAAQLADHISAYNATDDLVPYFGDARLAHMEAYYQLKNAVCLGYYGFYSQAFSTLRSVCELSLLQASLPEGQAVSDRTLDLLRSMLPPEAALPGRDEVNWILSAGFGATQSPEREAENLRTGRSTGAARLDGVECLNDCSSPTSPVTSTLRPGLLTELGRAWLISIPMFTLGVASGQRQNCQVAASCSSLKTRCRSSPRG